MVTRFALLALAVILAGCGGSAESGDEAAAATPEEAAACLTSNGATVNANVAQLEISNVESQVTYTLPANEVSLFFTRSPTDADNALASLELLAESLGGNTDGLTDRVASTAVAWEKTPTDEERELVVGCL